MAHQLSYEGTKLGLEEDREVLRPGITGHWRRERLDRSIAPERDHAEYPCRPLRRVADAGVPKHWHVQRRHRSRLHGDQGQHGRSSTLLRFHGASDRSIEAIRRRFPWRLFCNLSLDG